MNTNVTIVFMQKVEILLILMICIFIILCVLVIFGVIMLSHLCMQRRHKKTLECKGYQHQHLHQYPPDHHYNAPHLHQSPHVHGTLSVFTVEKGTNHLPIVSPYGRYNSTPRGPARDCRTIDEFTEDVNV